ncbi:MAG: hypothetical protein JJU11_13045 [Candidatus Sumerlaeia bacterium]|nr:hypothetical protein [Candidatus Sumerlaeia bacterium]
MSRFFRIVQPADVVTPPPGGTLFLNGEQSFDVQPVQVGSWTYEWRLNGVLLHHDESGITLGKGDIRGGGGELEARIVHESPWMRLETVSATYEWTIEVETVHQDNWMIH